MKRMVHYSRLFLLMGVLWALSLVVIFSAAGFNARRNALIALHKTVSDEFSETFSLLTDAETGQQGYLLTGDERYLEPYEAALERLDAQLSKLRARVIAREADPRAVAEIERLVEAKTAELKHLVDLQRNQGPEAALAVVRSDTGRQEMEQLRMLIDRQWVEQGDAVTKAEENLKRATFQRTLIILTTIFANLAFLVWCFRRIRQEARERSEAAREAGRQRDLLEVTLLSIGDAVIIADTEGRITLMNDIAVEVTGWPREEALGKPCSEVFKIVAEVDRQPVESPVEKVLQSGTIAGLGHHTLLIRRDGSEVPIDHSGAPVREADGTLRGVVLVFRDFSDHQRAQKELVAASQAKDQFLATLSHELRTPLTPALLQTRALAADRSLSESTRNQLNGIGRFIELEARLIDDLLDLTAIARGKMTLRRGVVDLDSLIRHVVEIVKADAEDKKLEITVRLAATEHHLNADGTRIQQVLWNLVKNAVKFTPAGGRVIVTTANPEPGRVQVLVEDTGTGIAPEKLERLFKPFDQMKGEAPSRDGGLGLGLAISKAIVDRHEGKISAESAGPNKGATFLLEMTTTTAPAAMPVPRKPAPASSGQERVLLVEDHGPTLAILAMLLEREGYQVTTADSIAGGLAEAAQKPFDVLVSDLGLPDGHGATLLRKLREQGYTFPAIAVSGYGQEEDRNVTQEAGFRIHLVKPVDIPELKEAIDEALMPA